MLLDRKKEQYRVRMQACQEKELQLASKQEQLKERVLKFDKFLRDNDTKRMRALRKEHDEVKLAETKVAEIQSLTGALVQTSTERDDVESTLIFNERYEQFLLRVCDSSEDFQEIPDILMRHDTLVASSNDLFNRVTRATADAEEMRATLATFMKEAQTESLVLNSEIASLQQQLEDATSVVQQREAVVSRNQGGVKERSRELGEILMAIQNVYARCVRSRGQQVARDALSARRDATTDSSEILALLTAIELRVTDLQAVIRQMQQRRGPATIASEPRPARELVDASPSTMRATGGAGASVSAVSARKAAPHSSDGPSEMSSRRTSFSHVPSELMGRLSVREGCAASAQSHSPSVASGGPSSRAAGGLRR